MARWPMLLQRGSTWYYRRSIPLALRPLMAGRRELWRSLRTEDRHEARLLGLKVGAEVERHFQTLKKKARLVTTTTPAPFLAISEDVLTVLHDDGTKETAENIAEIRDMEIEVLRRSRVLEEPATRAVSVADLLTSYLPEKASIQIGGRVPVGLPALHRPRWGDHGGSGDHQGAVP